MTKIELTTEERATIIRLCDWAAHKSQSQDAKILEQHKALLAGIAKKMGAA